MKHDESILREVAVALKTEPAAIRAQYRRHVSERISAFSHVFRGSGMDYVVLTTDTPFDKGLGAYLSWRGAQI